MSSRLMGLLGAALLLVGACGGSTPPTSSSPIRSDVFFVNAGDRAIDMPDIGLYESNWVSGQGFKLFVHGILSGGVPPYKEVKITYQTRGSSIHYDPTSTDNPIFGVIFVPANGDPRVRVQVTDGTSQKPVFDKLLPEKNYERAPAAPRTATAPSVRILGLQGPSLHGCSAKLSVLVGAASYDAYWSGGILANGTKVEGYKSQTLEAKFNAGEKVTVVVRDAGHDQGGRPAALVTMRVC